MTRPGGMGLRHTPLRLNRKLSRRMGTVYLPPPDSPSHFYSTKRSRSSLFTSPSQQHPRPGFDTNPHPHHGAHLSPKTALHFFVRVTVREARTHQATEQMAFFTSLPALSPTSSAPLNAPNPASLYSSFHCSHLLSRRHPVEKAPRNTAGAPGRQVLHHRL